MQRLVASAALALSLGAGCASASNKALEARLATSEAKFDRLIELLTASRALPAPGPDPAKTYAVAVDDLDPVEGPADAKVTIIEAYEFLCPYCHRASATVEALRSKYGNDVRVVSKYMVIHGSAAVPPALLACSAGMQGKFTAAKLALWDTLFDDDDNLLDDQVDATTLAQKVATATGLDLGMLMAGAGLYGKAAGESPCMAWIERSIDAMDALNVTATPAFFINGRFVSGAYPQATFEALIDEELAKANAAIAGGVPQASYYQTVIVGKGETAVAGQFDDL